MNKEPIRYELSKDGMGLMAVIDDDTSYHVHSDEMSDLEYWIYNLLFKRIKR
jgi:hypothetical protein